MSITLSTLDEKALRRPTFTEGHKVTLGDGREYTFPRPVLIFFPARAAGGDVGMSAEYGYDLRYQELRDSLIEVDAEDHYNATRIQVEIAGILLLKNYDLTNKHLRALLPLVPNDDANDAMWAALVPVVMASPPRTFPDGSDARS